MRIDYSNCDIINKTICFHDNILDAFNYDYNAEKIALILHDDISQKRIKMVFNYVIGFDMVACAFWGKSPHILDWECSSINNHLFGRLKREQEDNKYDNMIWETAFFEVMFTFTWGIVLPLYVNPFM